MGVHVLKTTWHPFSLQMAMNGFGFDREAGAAAPPSSEQLAEATLGLGHIVALHHRSSALHQVH